MPIASAEAEAGKRSGQPALIFFTVKSEASLPTQVRNVCGLKKVLEAPQASKTLVLCYFTAGRGTLSSGQVSTVR